MQKRYLGFAVLPLFVAACGSSDQTPTAVAAGAPTAAAVLPTAAAATGALGLTEVQLRDADLIDAADLDLGDVEAVARGADGAITGLIVEIEDTTSDRFVQIPLDGLQAVQRGNDWDVRTTATKDALLALPEVPRP